MANRLNWSILFFRGLAKLIDLIIVVVLWKMLSQAGLFIGIFYILISDGMFKGKSIGKNFLRIKVVNFKRESNADFRDSIIRNLLLGLSLFFLLIPILGWLICLLVILFEFILMVGDSEGKRLGDFFANTYVIEE